MRKTPIMTVVMLTVALLAGCNRAIPASADSTSGKSGQSNNAAFASQQLFVLPAGTAVPVRLTQDLDTRRNRAADGFTATLDEPLVSGDRVVVPKGTLFTGHVTYARSSGRFRGRAGMGLALDSFEMNGQTYQLSSTAASVASKGHKKRNWLWIGGGSGAGAALGAVAGGGVGALIGAGSGAAAGTVGAAITGKREVQLPAEARVSFKLAAPLEVRE
ncbi:MAG TPA: hypothetical protein VGR73_21970 [Bryobacteraceae bacterium]|nr:hypothetical protein [Bryobacteraceae bacterium]